MNIKTKQLSITIPKKELERLYPKKFIDKNISFQIKPIFKKKI